MIVQNVMSKKVITIPSGSNLKEAARILIKHKISGAPVLDREGGLIGIISEKDLFKALFPGLHELLADIKLWLYHQEIEDRTKDTEKIIVNDIMTREVLTIEPDAPVMRAGSIMLTRGVHRLVVYDRHEKRIVGMVSRGDIFRHILKKHLNI